MVANIVPAASVHPSGTRVKLVGLTGSQSLNGARGREVQANHRALRRYAVELCTQPSAEARSVNVKHKNLLVMTEEEFLEEQIPVGEEAAAAAEAERERMERNPSSESGEGHETTMQEKGKTAEATAEQASRHTSTGI